MCAKKLFPHERICTSGVQGRVVTLLVKDKDDSSPLAPAAWESCHLPGVPSNNFEKASFR